MTQVAAAPPDLPLKLNRLYDDYRTALYNRKYYGCLLQKYRRWNFLFEVAIAIASSSAIGSWLIWRSTDFGQNVWALISGITAVLAVVKPFLEFPKQIERYSKLFAGHGDVFHDLDAIVREVESERGFTSKINKKYAETLGRIKELAVDDDPQQDMALARRIQEEVNREIPPEELWNP
jgi:hypothetical protein